jgi:hypothetical protein
LKVQVTVQDLLAVIPKPFRKSANQDCIINLDGWGRPKTPRPIRNGIDADAALRRKLDECNIVLLVPVHGVRIEDRHAVAD